MNLFDKRFVINTGKGGVGKSTISAAIALAAARKGKRVLAIELNTRERISRLFNHGPVGQEITKVHENLFVVNATPDSAMKEYVLMKLRIEAVYRAVFENRFVRQFLRVIPGLNELVLIGKAWYHEQERDKRGRPIWDMIVVDAPATGHGLFFLKIPTVITEAVPVGPMYDECRKILTLLEDPKKTALNLITLTEEMPVNETRELKAQIDESLSMPMGYLIANGIYPRLFSAKQASQIETLRRNRPDRDDVLDRVVDAAIFRNQRCDLQADYLDRLRREVDMPMMEIPFYFDPVVDFGVIGRMADHVEVSVERQMKVR